MYPLKVEVKESHVAVDKSMEPRVEESSLGSKHQSSGEKGRALIGGYVGNDQPQDEHIVKGRQVEEAEPSDGNQPMHEMGNETRMANNRQRQGNRWYEDFLMILRIYIDGGQKEERRRRL